MLDGIILAGGYSSRLGQNKMNVVFQDKPVIIHTIEHMKSICETVYVVTGFYHEEILDLIKDLENVFVVFNHEYEKGMFTSVKKGVACVNHDFFIIPGDYPLVDETVYKKIKLGTKGIRVPSFSFKLGHPIFFEFKYKEELINTNLSDLKSFRNQFDFEIINVDSEGILIDIDTLEDLQHLKERE